MTDKTDDSLPFYKRKSLEEMTREEWESLCDGCGRCCLRTFEYEDTLELVTSRIMCRLFDPATCRCGNYPERGRLVDDCVIMTPENLPTLDFLPATCAYRRVARGQDLAWWHPLVSGDPETVHTAGISIRGRDLINEDDVSDEDLEVLDDDLLLDSPLPE